MSKLENPYPKEQGSLFFLCHSLLHAVELYASACTHVCTCTYAWQA